MALVPDDGARNLAEMMISQDAEDTMRSVLQETIESARGGAALESGRTVCGQDDVDETLEPFERYPTAVDLQQCPLGTSGGIWHTHVTDDEIQNPTHSITDYALVLYDEVDASVVVGTETAHVFVAPSDRDQAQDAFEEAVGAGPFATARDVTRAVQEGEIDLTTAPDAVDEAMAPLIDRVPTGFTGLDAQIGDVQHGLLASHPGVCAAHMDRTDADGDLEVADGDVTPVATAGRDVGAARCFQQRSIRAAETVQEAGEHSSFNIREMVIGTTIGTIVGGVVERAVFGSS